MYIPSLPTDVTGNWIWLQDDQHIDNRQVFFRKKFILDEQVAASELRICVVPFYHLFINGNHIGHGSAFSTNTHCYVDIYDISQYLRSGENIIGISTLDLLTLNWSMHSYPAKCWCQIFVNGKQVVVTDESWTTMVNDNFSGSQPRCHFGLARTEQKTYADESTVGWFLDSYDDAAWDSAKVIQPFPEGKPAPVLSGLRPRFWNKSEAFHVTSSGIFNDLYKTTYYNYQGFSCRPPGNYAAQSFAFSIDECDVEMQISTDDPYMVFCNGDLVAVNQKSFALDRYESQESLQPGMDILEGFSIHLKKGWNSFLCFQNLSKDISMGLMLLFPKVRKGHLQFQQECSNDISKSGWRLYGPLQVPFNFSAPSFQPEGFPDLPQVVFIPSEENVNDTSAYLSICDFSVNNDRDPQALRQGEFLLYDLGRFHYGFPFLNIEGTSGDIIDVTCGLRLAENQIPMTIGPLGRMTDTLILGKESTQWIRMLPRGSRYVMISVRRAASCVKPVFHFISAASELGSDSYFECSDNLLNDGWKRAMDSLIPCISQNIIDDPCAKRCQTLPEAFIYSRTLYNLSGGCDIPEKALREFSETQLETGMIMKTAPSGFYAYSPDAALLWIIWLQDHWMYTGDLDFIRSMEPCLTRLLHFFRMLSPENHAVLQSERAGHCMFLNKNLDMEESNIFTMLNALYYRALVAAFKLYAAMKMKEQTIFCEQLAAQLVEELIFYVRNSRTGIFSDAYLETGRSDKASAYTNLMVLNSGMIKTYNDIANLLKFCCRNEETLLKDCDSPFLFFILETLFDYKKSDLAFRLLRRALDRSLDKPCIYALGGNPHITCITAAGFMIRQLLGVRPAVPGGTQISFEPASSLLSGVRCRLPMGDGLVSVEWEVSGQELHADLAGNTPIMVTPRLHPDFEVSVDINKFITLLPAQLAAEYQ